MVHQTENQLSIKTGINIPLLLLYSWRPFCETYARSLQLLSSYLVKKLNDGK
jgi:hypothetical protein